MANHGYISSKKNLKKDQVYKDLQEINQRRFKGLLNIECAKGWSDNAWEISYHESGEKHLKGFTIWISSKRKLEHRHEDFWVFYLEIVFSHELGFKYNGKISDECCDEKWDPDPNKYPTYKSWLETRYSHLKNKNLELYSELINMEMQTCPIPFLNL